MSTQRKSRNRKEQTAVRERMCKTGESYTAALHKLRAQRGPSENLPELSPMTELFFKLRTWFNDVSQPECNVKEIHAPLGIPAAQAKNLIAWCVKQGLLEEKWPAYELTALALSLPFVQGRELDDMLKQTSPSVHEEGRELVWWSGECSIRIARSERGLKFLLRWNVRNGHFFDDPFKVREFVGNAGSERTALRELFEKFRRDVEEVIGGVPAPIYSTPGSDPSISWWGIWLDNLTRNFNELVQRFSPGGHR